MEIKCPRCKRFLAEVGGYGRAICRDCAVEVTVRDKKAEDRLTIG